MLVSAVWLAPAVLATISALAQSRIHGEPTPSVRDLLWSGGDWLVYAILTPPIFYVSRLLADRAATDRLGARCSISCSRCCSASRGRCRENSCSSRSA